MVSRKNVPTNFKDKRKHNMKKLLTILAASAMFFAFGEDISNGINFEAYTAYGEGSFNPLGDDPGTESQYWYSASSVGNVISNHVAAPVLPSGVTVPDMFVKDTSNTNFLYLETESPLFRTVKTNTHDPTEFVNNGVSILENPIYLDTLVKFTAADSAFTSLEDAADKIAIEYVEHEEESHEDPEGHTNIVDSVGFTNFVIRAGYLSSPIAQTNYYAAVPANFDKDAWHRLTVRSFGSIDAAGNVGFVVYLDGVPLEYDTGVEAGPGFAATGAAAAFYTDSLHALYPSAIPANQTGGQAIAAVAFSGNGSVDDVVFTTDMPKFIKDGESVRTEITLGTGITGVTVTVGENEINPLDATATPLVFNLPAGTTAFVLGVTADGDNGYEFDAATGITASNDVTYAGTTITITGGSPALTVVGKRDNAYYMDGETKVGFATLSEAFTSAPAGATIKLGFDYSVADNETTSPTLPVYTINKNVVLDLNGKTLDGGSSNNRFLFKVAKNYTLTVIDSVPGDEGSIVYGGTKGIFDGNAGDVNIGLTSDCGPVIVGAVIGSSGWVTEVLHGKFLASVNTTEDDKFVCNSEDYGVDAVPGTCTVTLVGDYWVVEPASVGTYNVTVTPTANATYAAAYNDGGAAVEFVNDVAAVTVGKTITITATPGSGYEYAETPTGWTAGQDGKITIEVSAEATVAIPAPTAVVIGTYSVTVTPTANATYAAAYNDGGAAVEFVNDVAAVTVGKTITITATPGSGYEYAETPTGWTAGQDGKITIEVSAEATVAIPAPTAKSSYPSYITGHDDYKDEYDTWAQTYGADTASAYEAAFLLNIAPNAEDQTLKPTAITMEGGKVVITANQTLTSVNGKVYVKVATTLAGLSTAEWAEATLSEGKVQVTPGSSDTAGFYKIKVDF